MYYHTVIGHDGMEIRMAQDLSVRRPDFESPDPGVLLKGLLEDDRRESVAAGRWNLHILWELAKDSEGGRSAGFPSGALSSAHFRMVETSSPVRRGPLRKCPIGPSAYR